MFRAWLGAVLGVAVLGAAISAFAAAPDDAVTRGAYLFAAAGCAGCHTRVKPKGGFLAGGRRLDTQFGAFYPPNITPDPLHGIGRWSLADFVRAMRQGRGPDGTLYFPAFPYPSYSGMSDGDLGDLWAYLKTVPAVAVTGPEHDLDFPFNLRVLVWPWRWLYFKGGALRSDPRRAAQYNRGAYLVRAVGHCGECHSPRGLLGGVDRERELGGNAKGPEGKLVANITPHAKKGIGDWTLPEIASYLQDGGLPDGDYAGGAMVEVIENSTSRLTGADRRAIAVYLKSVPPQDGN